MPDVNQLVEKAITAYKSKQKSQARELLMQAVDIDDKHEKAWLWLSAVVDSAEDQQVCLENVLTINPQNERARKGLEEIYKKQGKPMPPQFAYPGAAAPRPASQPPASTASGWDSDFGGDSWSSMTSTSSTPAASSNPFAGTGFESNPWGSDSSDALFSAPERAATSVEWDKSPGKSAYGSGQQVAQPSEDEYDQWLAGLNLGQNASNTFTMTPAAPTSNPWGESTPSTPTPAPKNSGFSASDSSWDAVISSAPATKAEPPARKKDSDPFGGVPVTSSPFADSDEEETSFSFDFGSPAKPAAKSKAAPPSEPFQVTTRLYDDEEGEPPSIFGDGSFFADEADPFADAVGDEFSFGDDEDPFADVLAEGGVADKKAKKAAKKQAKSKPARSNRPTITPEQAQFFAAIPAEITAPAKNPAKAERTVMITTVVLGVLNLFALIGLAISLG